MSIVGNIGIPEELVGNGRSIGEWSLTLVQYSLVLSYCLQYNTRLDVPGITFAAQDAYRSANFSVSSKFMVAS